MNGAGGPARAARCRLRPGFADLLGLFLILLVVLLGGRRLFGDADAATHVATGSWILEHHEIPKVDPFSATRPGTEWFAHEWLADLGSALAYRACGWNGLVAAAATVISLAHVLLFRFLVRRGDDVLAAFGAVVAAAATASSHWLARPHLLTVLFVVVFTIVLEQVVHGRWGDRALFALPPLTLVWANVHGGFLVAFGVMACYGLGVLLVGRARRPLFPMLIATFAGATVCSLVNPWGWRLPWHLIAFLAVRGPALRNTSEFAPAAVDDRAGVALFVFAGLCAVGLACGLRAFLAERDGRGESRAPAAGPTGPFHPGTLLALALTTVMAIAAIRHVEVMVIFGALVVSGGLSSFLRLKTDPETRAHLAALRVREERSGGALVASALVIVWVLARLGLPPRAGFDPALFPVNAVAALKRSDPTPAGPVFAPDVWGGYLILEWPEARVFVDGRWDMYGDEFYKRYADIYLARPGWSSALMEAGVTLALLPRDAPLVEAMRSSADWIGWGSDETAVVFRRRTAS
jgi:hypothetical protein